MSWEPRILLAETTGDTPQASTPTSREPEADFADTKNTKRKTSRLSKVRRSRVRGYPTKRGLKPKTRKRVTIWVDGP
jgi:uncharacterized protein YbaP (TraB family)